MNLLSEWQICVIFGLGLLYLFSLVCLLSHIFKKYRKRRQVILFNAFTLLILLKLT